MVALVRALASTLRYSRWGDLVKIVAIMNATLRFTVHGTRRASARGFMVLVPMVVASAKVVLSVVTSVKVTVVSVYSGILAVSPVIGRGAQAVLFGVWADGKEPLVMASTLVGLRIGFSVNAIVAMLWATKAFHTTCYAAFNTAVEAIHEGPHPAIEIFLQVSDTPASEARTAIPPNPIATPGQRRPRCLLAPRNKLARNVSSPRAPLYIDGAGGVWARPVQSTAKPCQDPACSHITKYAPP